MSVTSEDLISLSPCAPHLTMLSTTSPICSTSTLEAAPRVSPQAISTSTLHHDLKLDMAYSRPKPREEMVLEGDQVAKAQYGSLVVITPLPESIVKRDILCRVRGGKVLSCILSKFNRSLVAIVMFEQPASAQHYVDFCAESFNKDLWTFPSGSSSGSGFIPFSHVEMTAQVKIYNDAPGLGVTWHPEDIPGFLKTYPSSTTRCLSLENCNVERVAGIWAQLGLAGSEHLRNQLDDMWLDRPEWNAAASKYCGTLHIWYTDIRVAMEARRRCLGLKHEADPCSTMPDEAFILGPEKAKDGSGEGSEEVYVDYHSYPSVSFLDLHKASVLDMVSRGVLDPYAVFWGIRASQPETEQIDPKNLTGRLMHTLRTHVDGQRGRARGSTPTGIIYPPPGFAAHPSGGLVDPFMDGYRPSTASGMGSQSDNYRTHTLGPHEPATTGMNYGRIECPRQSHIHHDPPSTKMSHVHAQPSVEGHPSRKTSAMSMSYGVEDTPQSASTRPIDRPRPGRLDFKMPRPQPGYTNQFPPPLGGEPRVVEYPSAIAEAIKQESRGQGYLARRISSLVHQSERPQHTQPVAPHNPAHDDTSYQSGRPAGSGRSF